MTFLVTTRPLQCPQNRLGLEWIGVILAPERNLRGDFPGAASQGLAGPLNHIHPNRIQIMVGQSYPFLAGWTEICSST